MSSLEHRLGVTYRCADDLVSYKIDKSIPTWVMTNKSYVLAISRKTLRNLHPKIFYLPVTCLLSLNFKESTPKSCNFLNFPSLVNLPEPPRLCRCPESYEPPLMACWHGLEWVVEVTFQSRENIYTITDSESKDVFVQWHSKV